VYRFGENTDKLSKWLWPYIHSVDFTGMMKGLKTFFAQVGFYDVFFFVSLVFFISH
jgi:hypothetical protein